MALLISSSGECAGGSIWVVYLWKAFLRVHGGTCASWTMKECDHLLHVVWIRLFCSWRPCAAPPSPPFFILGNGLMVSKIYMGNNHLSSLCCWGAAGCLMFPFESHWPLKGLFTTLPLTYVHMHISHYWMSKGPFSQLNSIGQVLALTFFPFHCTDCPALFKLLHKVNTFHSSQPS
jgi:hypothetical protein